MTWILCGMLALAVGCAVATGQAGALGTTAMEGAQSAVRLGLTLAGSLCLWSGVGEAMRQNGMAAGLARLLRPALGRLFPKTAQDGAAMASLSANVTANLLGLGNAATPMGIETVRRMPLERNGGASDEMCRFVVLNTASVQLLPTTVAALRAGLGSAAPFSILPAVWVTSLCSVAVGLLAARVFAKLWKR